MKGGGVFGTVAQTGGQSVEVVLQRVSVLVVLQTQTAHRAALTERVRV